MPQAVGISHGEQPKCRILIFSTRQLLIQVHKIDFVSSRLETFYISDSELFTHFRIVGNMKKVFPTDSDCPQTKDLKKEEEEKTKIARCKPLEITGFATNKGKCMLAPTLPCHGVLPRTTHTTPIFNKIKVQVFGKHSASLYKTNLPH